MRYDLRRRTATALVRRSFDTRWHEEDALDEYERRLDSCRERWEHPLVLPIVLLQVQLYRTEEEVFANNGEVLSLEVCNFRELYSFSRCCFVAASTIEYTLEMEICLIET